MIIKNFSEEYLKPVAKLLRLNLESKTMPDFLLEEKTFGDPDYDSGLTFVALDEKYNDNVIGFAQGIVRDVKDNKLGYIKLLCVDTNERKKGIGSKLYNRIEEKLKEENITKVRLCESFPNYLTPGIECNNKEAISFFEKQGFQKFDEVKNLYIDLLIQNYETFKKELDLNEFGYFVKRASKYDLNKILNFTEQYFPVWKTEVQKAFGNDPVSLFFAEHEGDVVGFSTIEVNNRGTGSFGPIGIIDEYKNHGVGGLLLIKAVKDLKDLGFVKATIPWVRGPKFFHKYLKIDNEKTFCRFEKLAG